MTDSQLTCKCGYVWMYDGPGPIPDDVQSICPMCSPGDASAQTKVASFPNMRNTGQDDTSFTLTPGVVLSGFEILGEINRGGMGIIYKARQKGLDRIVALKVISPSRLGNPDSLKRFKQEVKAAAKVSHPNIVQVYLTELDGPLPFLAMEFVDGIDLSRLIKTKGPIPVVDACHYIQQAALGLQHAHEEGLVHRDIKPANLMLTPSPLLQERSPNTGRIPKLKILDMGLARVVSENDNEPGELTRDGIFLGTPDFVAPEQAEDSRRADIRADIYSLGSSFYYFLTGKTPFPGTTIVQKLRRQMTEPAPSAMAERREVSPALDALIRRMMMRDPNERPQTPGEVHEHLDRILRGTPMPNLTVNTQDSHSSGIRPQFHPATGPVIVRAHEGGIRGIAITPDGKNLLSGGHDGTLKVWNAPKLKQLTSFEGDVGSIDQLALAPNGKWAVTCSTRLTLPEMRVQIWDVATGKEHGNLSGARDNYRGLAISPDGKRVAAGSSDKTVWVWSFESDGPLPLCLKGHTSPVTAVVFGRNGDSLLSSDSEGNIRQWELPTGKERGTRPGLVGPIHAIALGGKRFALAGNSLSVRQRDGSITQLVGHDGPVYCVAFSPDGSLIASGGSDTTVRIWRTEDGSELACYTGHTKAVWVLAFSLDSTSIYSGGDDGTLRKWTIEVGSI